MGDKFNFLYQFNFKSKLGHSLYQREQQFDFNLKNDFNTSHGR